MFPQFRVLKVMQDFISSTLVNLPQFDLETLACNLGADQSRTMELCMLPKPHETPKPDKP